MLFYFSFLVWLTVRLVNGGKFSLETILYQKCHLLPVIDVFRRIEDVENKLFCKTITLTTTFSLFLALTRRRKNYCEIN